MSKILDILNNLLTLNPNADYDFSISPKGEKSEKDEDKPTPYTKKKESDNIDSNSDTVRLSNEKENEQKFVSEDTYNKAKQELETLKQVNYALLMQTPIGNTDNDKPLEEMLYNVCVGRNKKKE